MFIYIESVLSITSKLVVNVSYKISCLLLSLKGLKGIVQFTYSDAKRRNMTVIFSSVNYMQTKSENMKCEKSLTIQ